MLRKRLLGAILFLLVGSAQAFAWSFAVCGDSRGDKDRIFPQVLSAVDRSDMEFLIHTGDLENGGGAAAWKAFRARTATFRKPIHLVIGNHEIRGGGTAGGFARFFGLAGSSYSFTYRDAHFTVVDDADGSLSAETLAWLDRDLSAHPKRKGGTAFLIVAMHIPPRTDGIFPHGTVSAFGDQSEKLYRILARHAVDAILCGHEHMQYTEDWGGVLVLVSGGAGAPLMPFQKYGFYRIDLQKGKLRETFLPVPPPR
jgi:3',5'-cyclic AMP phosphodiesterase CpdA